MPIIRIFVFVITLLSFAHHAFSAERATPFGLDIGADTLQSCKTIALEKGYSLSNAGTNKYTNGPMLNADISQLNVNDVKNILLIFSQDELLEGVIFKSKKFNFENFEQYVAGKYQLLKRDVPFVGDKYAEYEAPNAVIQLDAPHLGFQMSVNYITQSLLDRFTQKSKADAAKQRKTEASQF